ncbi:MAG: ABC transporter permease [Granulosicoccus sp.]|nr:ABC transporter permease [Granulosicoccus sp.]
MNSTEYSENAAKEMLSNRSFWADARIRFFKNRMAIVAVGLLASIILFAIFGGMFAQYTNEEIDWSLLGKVKELGGPSLSNGHWFGVDELGRDLYARVVQGTRVSLMVGFLAGTISVMIGSTIGAIAGYYGGRFDQFVMAAFNISVSIPYIIFFVVWQAFFGRSVLQMIIVMIIINWASGLLIARGQVMTLKNREYVDAARMLGLSDVKIIIKHIMPNMLWVIIIYTSITIPEAIMMESIVSFLGVGIQEPATSWGKLISEGASTMTFGTLWQLAFPAVFFALNQISLYYIGDGLRDALDPKERA